MCELKKAPKLQICPQTFVHDCSSRSLRKLKSKNALNSFFHKTYNRGVIIPVYFVGQTKRVGSLCG